MTLRCVVFLLENKIVDMQKMMDYFKTSEDFEILWKAIEKEIMDHFKAARDEQVESVLRVVRSVALYTWNAAKANAIPDGYVVIPKEPNYAMVEAGSVAGYRNDGYIESIWDAMIEQALIDNATTQED